MIFSKSPLLAGGSLLVAGWMMMSASAVQAQTVTVPLPNQPTTGPEFVTSGAGVNVDDEEIERDIRQIINNPRYVTAQRKAEEVEKYVRENLLGNGTSITAPCSQRYDAAIAALNIAADALGITSGALGAASQDIASGVTGAAAAPPTRRTRLSSSGSSTTKRRPSRARTAARSATSATLPRSPTATRSSRRAGATRSSTSSACASCSAGPCSSRGANSTRTTARCARRPTRSRRRLLPTSA